MITLVVDPGHGGSDTGTLAGGLVEKTLNLDTALRFKQRIEANYDVKVVLTRETDVDVALSARPAIANAMSDDVVFLSFHHNNSGGATTPRGFETYVYGDKSWAMSDGRFAPRSFELAKAMEPAIKAMCASLGLPYVGVKDGNFAVLRECKRRAILFESFYASNPQDCEIARRGDFIDRLVDGYVSAVVQALDVAPKAKGPFVDIPADHPFASELADMKAQGVLNGQNDGRLALSSESVRLLVIMRRMVDKAIAK